MKAQWERVLCHFDEDGKLDFITRGNGEIAHYQVERLGIEELGDKFGANRVAFNNLNEHEN